MFMIRKKLIESNHMLSISNSIVKKSISGITPTLQNKFMPKRIGSTQGIVSSHHKQHIPKCFLNSNYVRHLSSSSASSSSISDVSKNLLSSLRSEIEEEDNPSSTPDFSMFGDQAQELLKKLQLVVKEATSKNVVLEKEVDGYRLSVKFDPLSVSVAEEEDEDYDEEAESEDISSQMIQSVPFTVTITNENQKSSMILECTAEGIIPDIEDNDSDNEDENENDVEDSTELVLDSIKFVHENAETGKDEYSPVIEELDAEVTYKIEEYLEAFGVNSDLVDVVLELSSEVEEKRYGVWLHDFTNFLKN